MGPARFHCATLLINIFIRRTLKGLTDVNSAKICFETKQKCVVMLQRNLAADDAGWAGAHQGATTRCPSSPPPHWDCQGQEPEPKSSVPDWGIKSTLAYRVKVDSGRGLPSAHGKCVGVYAGLGIRCAWGYSQLRHKVPYTRFFYGLGPKTETAFHYCWRDPGWKTLRSGINIPDPQHCTADRSWAYSASLSDSGARSGDADCLAGPLRGHSRLHERRHLQIWPPHAGHPRQAVSKQKS